MENVLSLDQTDDLRLITKRSIPTIQRTLSTKRKTTSLRLSSCARKCYSTRPCVHVPSLHIHLDIAHNSSSYSLIIIIRSLPRSTGSFPSNNERNGSKFITCRACVRMSSLLDRATVMMTTGIWYQEVMIYGNDQQREIWQWSVLRNTAQINF